ncbi:MAG: family 43 glycosylhydrolase [Oscillospiraceae bacterium]|jgi:beta-fructofuranosidase|nr:family 43 glycosylhydrolase [Oscillospiraceae bacterium]
MSTILTPRISGAYQLLLKPEQYGNYVNDHSLILAHDGNWHLFGITSFGGGPAKERYFVHGITSSLDKPMREAGVCIDNGTRAWAPAVFAKDGLYYMYYGPSPTKLNVSWDLGEWMGYDGIQMRGMPPLCAHRDHFVLELDDGTYLMYLVGTRNRFSCVSVFESKDLFVWDFAGYALTSSGNAPLNPPWGAFESPYVVKKDGLYYLFIMYTDSGHETYEQTFVITSEDPRRFGNYTGDNHEELVLTTLQSHAGEVVYDAKGKQWYITTCGWLGSPNPIPGACCIAPLVWEN